MSKIIVRRQEYANNGTHADEIEAVVQENLIVNTMSSATDVAPSAALLKSVNDKQEIYAGTTINNIQVPFTGKATSDKTGFFGGIILPKQLNSGVTNATFSNAANYGAWYSDGMSHTLDLANIVYVEKHYNVLWAKIPATNIDSTNGIAWIRLNVSITFS